MNIHEYQAKTILDSFGVPVPKGKVVVSPEEAFEVAREFEGVVAVKAQIHAGGRGKAGGVKIARNAEEAKSYSQSILGSTLVTHQTGPEGRVVSKVLIEEGVQISREFYLGLLVDRNSKRPVVMALSLIHI